MKVKTTPVDYLIVTAFGAIALSIGATGGNLLNGLMCTAITVSLAGWVITDFEFARSRQGYWPVVGALFVGHFALMYGLLRKGTNLALVNTLLIATVEAFVVALVINAVFAGKGSNTPDGSDQ